MINSKNTFSFNIKLFNKDDECSYLSEKERIVVENFRKLSEEKANALLVISELLNK